MSENITVEAQEQSTLTLTIKVTDASGDAVTPTAAKYTVTDKDGTVIDDQLDIAITPLGESMTVNLAGDNLEIIDQDNDRELRIFTVETDRGNVNLPENRAVKFWVNNLKAIT